MMKDAFNGRFTYSTLEPDALLSIIIYYHGVSYSCSPLGVHWLLFLHPRFLFLQQFFVPLLTLVWKSVKKFRQFLSWLVLLGFSYAMQSHQLLNITDNHSGASKDHNINLKVKFIKRSEFAQLCAVSKTQLLNISSGVFLCVFFPLRVHQIQPTLALVISRWAE